MRTKPYRTAIALFDEVELLDVTGPVSVLSSAGRQWNFQPFKLDFVAASLGPVRTRSELSLQSTQVFASHRGAECLIVPGGYGARRAAENEPLLDWLRACTSSAEFVVAIGNGVWLLAKAGLLENHEVSVNVELAAELAALCPSATPNAKQPLCSSGKILSARASAWSLDLSCELVARCFGKKLASTLSASLGIEWSGELETIEIVPAPLLVK